MECREQYHENVPFNVCKEDSRICEEFRDGLSAVEWVVVMMMMVHHAHGRRIKPTNVTVIRRITVQRRIGSFVGHTSWQD